MKCILSTVEIVMRTKQNILRTRTERTFAGKVSCGEICPPRFEPSTRHWCSYFSGFISKFNRCYSFSGRRCVRICVFICWVYVRWWASAQLVSVWPVPPRLLSAAPMAWTGPGCLYPLSHLLMKHVIWYVLKKAKQCTRSRMLAGNRKVKKWT